MDYLKLISENWRWSIFHDKIKVKFYAASFGLFVFCAICLAITASAMEWLNWTPEPPKIVELPNHVSQVRNYFFQPIKPVTMTSEQIAETYVGADDLPKLPASLTERLNGQVSELKPKTIALSDYAGQAQSAELLEMSVSESLKIYTLLMLTPADILSGGRYFAYAHVQRAGLAVQDIIAITHDFD